MARGRTASRSHERRDGRRGRRGRFVAPLVCTAVAFALGCAPTQWIAISAGPEPVVVFVDGKRVEPVPETLELKATRDHTLFFQREGYQSQLVVVRTRDLDGAPQLEPARVDVRLKRVVTSGPSITVEVDDTPIAE